MLINTTTMASPRRCRASREARARSPSTWMRQRGAGSGHAGACARTARMTDPRGKSGAASPQPNDQAHSHDRRKKSGRRYGGVPCSLPGWGDPAHGYDVAAVRPGRASARARPLAHGREQFPRPFEACNWASGAHVITRPRIARAQSSAEPQSEEDLDWHALTRADRSLARLDQRERLRVSIEVRMCEPCHLVGSTCQPSA